MNRKNESNKKTKACAIRMRSDMFERLEKESIYHNISVGTIVRHAISCYLSATEGMNKEVKSSITNRLNEHK
jgi:predicted DNA-binding protein